MARQEKGTRTRGRPPKVQLGLLDNLSGSYPTRIQFSPRGLVGQEGVSFDDLKTMVFGQVTASFFPGIGLPSGSAALRFADVSDIPLSTTIRSSGAIQSRVIGDSSLTAPNLESATMRPFVEQSLYESDGKSANNKFFATGSSVAQVGEGFDSPLWSKQKIEIDISVRSSTSLNLQNSSTFAGVGGLSYPMAYYNFSTKTWDPIGLGYEINSNVTPLPNAIRDGIDNLMIGFAAGFNPPGNSVAKLVSSGYCVSDFGFPYHPKFHATSSQVLNMRNYIDRPFVLEKAVIAVSASWQVGSPNTSAYNIGSRRTVTASINTCFLLNQRRNQSLDLFKALGNYGGASSTQKTRLTSSIPVFRVLNWNASSPTYIDTLRDIVGFSQVFSFAKDAYDKLVYDSTQQISSSPGELLPITANDIVLQNPTNSGTTGSNWTSSLVFSMSMCTPAASTPYQLIDLGGTDISVSGGYQDFTLVYDDSLNYSTLFPGHDGSRSGLGIISPSTRGLRGDFFQTAFDRRISFPAADNGTKAETAVPRTKHKINPYILQPSDQLILGWQLPISINVPQFVTAGQNESTITFLTGTFKMTLYGSYIRDGVETNDTTSQLLTSKAIHEIIG